MSWYISRRPSCVSRENFSPCLLHHLVLPIAGEVGDVLSWRAAERGVADVANGQEVRAQTSYAELGHVGERLAHAAAEQEAAQLLVERRDVEVAYEGARVYAAVTHPVAFAQGDLAGKREDGDLSFIYPLYAIRFPGVFIQY